MELVFSSYVACFVVYTIFGSTSIWVIFSILFYLPKKEIFLLFIDAYKSETYKETHFVHMNIVDRKMLRKKWDKKKM